MAARIARYFGFFFLAALLLIAFNMLSTQSVRADTPEARILSYSWYVAPSNTVIAAAVGDLIAVGEIENVGSNIIGNVTVEGSALSSNGQVLATTSSQAFVYHMLPGQRAPFYLDFSAQSSSTQDLSWVSSVRVVTVSVSSVTDTTESTLSGLTIPAEGGSVSYAYPNGTFVVIGTVENLGNQAAEDPWVVATFYNASGTVVGLNYTDELTPSLTPGNAIRFYATPTDDTSQLTSEIANYTLVVDSLTLTNSAPSSTPPPSSSSTTSSSKSTGKLPTLPIVVIVVVVVVVIAALLLLRKRQKLPQPPPPPPPPPMP
ncbi:MAG: FxLYD domain-containing protein [Candidatus Bathyarchaeia archaeon]|jgi:hypothetical protein